MFIVQIASECAPVAKVGGLGDVVFGLTRELEIRGHSVEIILPKYDCMRYDHIWGMHVVYERLEVSWYGGIIECSVWFGFVHGRKCFFIDPHSSDHFFERGLFYGHRDDPMRFAFFSKAALEFLFKSGKRPEIIHCHDWQTGLVPVLLFEIYKFHGMERQRVCYTIHNFKHQGVTGSEILEATGLCRPDYYLTPERMQDNSSPAAINLMKGGIVFANFITTVSPNHAWEARFTDQGHGLGATLHAHHAKFGGVLNGLDYEVWNPESDGYIPFNYNAESLENKFRCKEALRDRLLLRQEYKPIVCYVGRLDAQKGVDLIRHAIFFALEMGAQFVLLGSSPDPDISRDFWQLKHHLNDNPDCHLEIGFNEELSHLIYAGSEIIVVPSMFEPCGLTQMLGLRYGTVPVVRQVGGLTDTVFDIEYSDRPLEQRNGYSFEGADYAGVESGLRRAIGLWQGFPERFRELVIQGMRSDYSWNRPGQDYQNIYELIREP